MAATGDPFVIFADIDNILFDCLRASFEESAAALDLLKRNGIPLVLCSGKTRAQLERLSGHLGLTHPFICEHGAAIIVPAGYFGSVQGSRNGIAWDIVDFGPPYAQVASALRRAAQRCKVEIVGFHDMSTEEVAFECRLPLMEARLAKLREYDEPFRIVGGPPTARQRLFRTLRAEGYGCRAGRRFDHVGATVDVDAGIQFLTRLYRQSLGPSVTTVGFGIAPDHAPLLASVDRAFALRLDDHPPAGELLHIRGAEAIEPAGVAGWAATVVRLVTTRSSATSPLQ